jgi:DNA replication and repair protein RecF
MPLFSRLELTQFRNIEHAVIEPGPGFNVLYGSNGSGKTNVLEALFFLSVGKSQRGAPSKDFIRFGADHFAITASVRDRDHEREIRASGSPKGHAFFINHQRLESVADLIGNVLAVSFSPDDLSLSSGPPSERRRYLNMLLSQSDINYFIGLIEYNRTLAQRNACLKWSAPDFKFLSVLTETLVRKGAELRCKRRGLIETLVPHAQRLLAGITDNAESLSLAYQPEGPRDPVSAEKELASAFEECARQEAAMQSTLCGPHLDDFEVLLDGNDARRFASRGQHRSLSLSLKLAAVDFLKAAKGGPCVLLLDDIFAELDEKRAGRLIGCVQAGDQVFAASPQPLGRDLPPGTGIFQIEEGRIGEAHGRA